MFENIKIKHFFACFLTTIILVMANIAPMLFIQTNTYASSAYYNDNMYESSSTYASIDQNDNSIIQEIDEIHNANIETNTYQDEKAKKIYNTIIIKTKKKKEPQQIIKYVKEPKPIIEEEKAEKIEEKTTEKKETEDKEEKKKTKLKKIEEEEIEENEEENEEEEIEKLSKLDKLRYYLSSTRVKKPDDWYLYALFGYTLGLPKKLQAQAVWADNEKADNSYNSPSVSGMHKINGWGFTAGIKKYFNRNIFAFYIAFESFYNRLSLNDLSFNYPTSQTGFFYNTSEIIDNANGYKVYNYNFTIPAEIDIAAKSTFGGSLRFGFTIANLISIFGKANIGATNYIITSKINFNNFDIGTIIANNGGEYAVQIKDRIVNNFNTMYQDTSSKKSMIFTYGLGVGVELTLWNQHLTMRVDYDHFFAQQVFKVDKLFARKVQQTINASHNNNISNNNVSINENGTKWKVKDNFGILKLTVGVSF